MPGILVAQLSEWLPQKTFASSGALKYFADLINDKSVCFTDEEGHLVAISIGWVEPIDTRTDKEKLKDKLKEIISQNNNDDAVEKIFKGITMDNIPNSLKEFGCVECTGK